MRAIDLTPAKWSQVRVLDLEECGAESPAPSAPITVRACIQLGELTPADVVVELVPGLAGDRTAAASTGPIHRFCSVMSYQNGSFLFEAFVAPTDLRGSTGYAIRVTPSPDDGHVPDVSPVIHRVPRRAGDAERAGSARAATDVSRHPQHR